jgi:DNA-binding transcriptional ArsR family regulator
MRWLHHPDRKDLTLAGVLYALGDPIRLEIVRRLASQDNLPDCGLAIAVAKSTVSHHFKMLRVADIIHSRQVGPNISIHYAGKI